MHLLRTTFAVAAVTVAVKVLGFAEKQALAFYFGADARVDALVVATSVPTALFLMVRELVEPVGLPRLVRHLEAGRRDRAQRLFAAVGGILAGGCVLVGVVGWLGAKPLSRLLGPGFSPATLELAAELLRWVLPAGIFLALSSWTYITLNADRRFVLPAASDLSLKVLSLVCLATLASAFGIRAAALGFLLGAAGRLGVQLWGLRRGFWPIRRPDGESSEDLRVIGRLALPLLLGVAFSQVSELADNFFASGLEEGAVAARSYARRIADLPVLLIPYALGIVAFPHMASLASRGQSSQLFKFLGRATRALAALFSYLAVATVLLAEPIVALLLQRGAFDAADRALTAAPLALYGVGLVTFAVEVLVVNTFFSLGDTRRPVLWGICGVVLNIALTAVLIGPLGVSGVAAALTLSKTFKVVALAFELRHHGAEIAFSSLVAAAGRALWPAAAAAAGITGVSNLSPWPGADATLLAQLGHLVLASSVGGALFLVVFLFIPSVEQRWLLAALRRGFFFRER